MPPITSTVYHSVHAGVLPRDTPPAYPPDHALETPIVARDSLYRASLATLMTHTSQCLFRATPPPAPPGSLVPPTLALPVLPQHSSMFPFRQRLLVKFSPSVVSLKGIPSGVIDVLPSPYQYGLSIDVSRWTCHVCRSIQPRG